MPKVLLLPLLQIPSGHHQVADAVSRWLSLKIEDLEIEKVEILSYFNATLEKLVSHVYLKWIDHFPRAYDWLYRYLSYHPTREKNENHRGYELLFLQTMYRLITEHQPHIIICTHALPSTLCSRLKVTGRIRQPVVNIYTDFFVNQLWGIEGIDLHFVPSIHVKQMLLQQGVAESSIYVTGIPVDHVFHQERIRARPDQARRQILLAGGSVGVGFDHHVFDQIAQEGQFQFTILCGKNEPLFEHILQLECAHIQPIRYISSREEMKQLYDQMDAIVTKPGGVTISEALYTGLPIFIHASLPGQEEINRDFLFQEQIAYGIDLQLPIVDQLLQRLSNDRQLVGLQKKIEQYRRSLEWEKGLAALTDHL